MHCATACPIHFIFVHIHKSKAGLHFQRTRKKYLSENIAAWKIKITVVWNETYCI